jgi:hypothetical protein
MNGGNQRNVEKAAALKVTEHLTSALTNANLPLTKSRKCKKLSASGIKVDPRFKER